MAKDKAAGSPRLVQFLTDGLEIVIRNGNPWWRGEPIAELPSFRRWAFEPVYRRLTGGLAPAIVLRGPRQIGKTTLLNQVVDQLIRDGVDPKRLFRLQFDDLSDLKTLGTPIVELVDWYAREVLGDTLNKAATEGRAAVFVSGRGAKPLRLGSSTETSRRPWESAGDGDGKLGLTDRGGPRQSGGARSNDRDGAVDVARNRRPTRVWRRSPYLRANGLAPERQGILARASSIR